MKKINKTNLIKAIAFVLCFGVILGIACIFLNRNTDTPRSWALMSEFYEQENDSLDVVLLGASNVYAFYQPAWAWEEYGITSWDYANSGRPFELAELTLKEARKTQPDALYIIPVDTFSQKADSAHIHFLTDYLPLSLNKLDIIDFYCDMSEREAAEDAAEAEAAGEEVTAAEEVDRTEYLIPLLRYHSRWKELFDETAWGYLFGQITKRGIKSSSYFNKHFTTQDVSSVKYSTTERAEIEPELEENIESLLDYCDEENVNVLFVSMPKCSGGSNAVKAQMCNTIGDIIQSRGYDYINYIDYIDEIGLDPATDYYNWKHTNILGAKKFTSYLANYLQNAYGIEDKRGKDGYDDWDEAAEKYNGLINKKLEKLFNTEDSEIAATEEARAGRGVFIQNLKNINLKNLMN